MNTPISGLRILPAEIETGLAREAGAGPGFADTLHSALQEVDRLQGEANRETGGVLAGGATDVHGAMIAVEKADLAFQLMLEVRNKIVQAYQEVSRLQF